MARNKSGYLDKLAKEKFAREYAIRKYTRQQGLDFVLCALGRMGYGEKRLIEFEKVLSKVFEDYADLMTDDLKTDSECIYAKSVLDRELKQYCGNSFVPYEVRYFGEA